MPRPSFTNHCSEHDGGTLEALREGRDCEPSRRLTVLLLFPRPNVVPGLWLLLLAGVYGFVAVRALELGHI